MPRRSFVVAALVSLLLRPPMHSVCQTCTVGANCRSYCAGWVGYDYLTTACPLTAAGAKANHCAGRVCENTSASRSDSVGCFCCCSRRGYKGPGPCPMEAGNCQATCKQSTVAGGSPLGVQCAIDSSLPDARTCGGRPCVVIVTSAAQSGCYCCCVSEA